MKWSRWVDKYPGLQDRMEFIVERMKAAYADEEEQPPKKNSGIVKEAKYLQRKFDELKDRYFRLEFDSMRANLPANVKEWMPTFDYEILHSQTELFLQLQSRLIRIETAHERRDSRDKSASIDEQFILTIVLNAVDCGLEISRKNAFWYSHLVDYCFLNAGIEIPDEADYLLSKVKRYVKHPMQK